MEPPGGTGLGLGASYTLNYWGEPEHSPITIHYHNSPITTQYHNSPHLTTHYHNSPHHHSLSQFTPSPFTITIHHHHSPITIHYHNSPITTQYHNSPHLTTHYHNSPHHHSLSQFTPSPFTITIHHHHSPITTSSTTIHSSHFTHILLLCML